MSFPLENGITPSRPDIGPERWIWYLFWSIYCSLRKIYGMPNKQEGDWKSAATGLMKWWIKFWSKASSICVGKVRKPVTHGGGSVMIWGCMYITCKSSDCLTALFFSLAMIPNTLPQSIHRKKDGPTLLQYCWHLANGEAKLWLITSTLWVSFYHDWSRTFRFAFFKSQ